MRRQRLISPNTMVYCTHERELPRWILRHDALVFFGDGVWCYETTHRDQLRDGIVAELFRNTLNRPNLDIEEV